MTPALMISHRPVTDISGADTDSALESMWLSGRPDHTKRAYTGDIARFRRFTGKPIRSLTAADIVGYAESLTGLAPSSQHRMLSAVKSLMTFAHRLGYIGLDPAAALRMPKPNHDRVAKILPRAAVLAVIAAAKEGRNRLICKTLYLCGLREAELISLAPSDVRETESGWAMRIDGKGGKSRTIAVPAVLAADLLAQGTESPIFRSESGKPLSPSDVYRMVRKAGESVGYRVTPHMLRHAHASHALDAGAPLHVVRECLGHSSLQTTSIYTHAKPSDGSALYL